MKCVTLVIQLGVDAEPVQDLVGVVQVRARRPPRPPGERRSERPRRDRSRTWSAPAGESSTVRLPWRIATIQSRRGSSAVPARWPRWAPPSTASSSRSTTAGVSPRAPAVVQRLEEAVKVVPTEASAQALRCFRGEIGSSAIRQGRRTVELSPAGALTFYFDPVAAIRSAARLAAAAGRRTGPGPRQRDPARAQRLHRAGLRA